MKIRFVTLFPDVVLAATRYSILQRAEEAGLVAFAAVNPRDFASDKHRTVDDSPYGGGPGMLMRPEPVAAALESLGLQKDQPVVMLDPTGTPFRQSMAEEWAQSETLTLVCGHYEGIDHRIEQLYATHVVSIGDYVLTGGELPALVIADAVTRLQKGALGDPSSLEIDSFALSGLLSAPQYTRPEEFRGLGVPPVLLSGDHRAIAAWKRACALKTTRDRRPDLLPRAHLEPGDLDVLTSSS